MMAKRLRPQDGPESHAFLSRRLHSPLRWPAAAMLIISALAHVPVVAPGLAETTYIGILFILLIISNLVLTVALLLRDSLAVWAMTALILGLAFLAYVLSRTVGLPLQDNYIGDWVSTPGLASLISAGVGCAIALVVLIRQPKTA